jgi:hypothetical protein
LEQDQESVVYWPNNSKNWKKSRAGVVRIPSFVVGRPNMVAELGQEDASNCQQKMGKENTASCMERNSDEC